MAIQVNISATKTAQTLAQAEYLRLEIMINSAMWDNDLTDDEKPIIIKYLNRKKEEAAQLVNIKNLCEQIK
jgi:hypothetical protein